MNGESTDAPSAYHSFRRRLDGTRDETGPSARDRRRTPPGHNDTLAGGRSRRSRLHGGELGQLRRLPGGLPGGDATSCSTRQFSDLPNGSQDQSMFYARKHSPLLLTWSQSPDALVVNDGPGGAEDLTPGVRSDRRRVPAHVHDFRTTPRTRQRRSCGTSPATSRSDASRSSCRGCATQAMTRTRTVSGPTPTRAVGRRGSIGGSSCNLDGLRRDVGRNGVVIVTFDEDHTSDGAGVVAPVFTAIVPGLGAGGETGVLDAPGCDPNARVGLLRPQPPVRPLLDGAFAYRDRGGSASVFDNASIYRGRRRPRAGMRAARPPPPLAVIDATP